MPALLALLVALILYVTLYPFQFDFGLRHTNIFLHLLHSWPARIDRGFFRDAAANVALFLPLGVTACVTYARHWKRGTAFTFAVLHAALLSLAIEILQYFERSRYSSIADFLFNTLGALCGAAIGLAFQKRIEAVTSAAERRGAGPGVLLSLCWMAAQIYPLVPMVKLAYLRQSLRYLLASRMNWVEVFACAAAWFVFGLALRTIWPKLPRAWLVVALLVVPMRLAIWDRAVTWSDVAGAALGLALWCVIPDGIHPGAGWVLMVLAVVFREFAPFHFASSPHPFSWHPFAATMANENSPGLTVILRKGFEYGSLVWLMRAGKWRYRTAGMVTAAGLFVMEWIQTRLPGRSPEITDSLLALLMALMLWLVDV